MLRTLGLVLILSTHPFISTASSASIYNSFGEWRNAMQGAGYQVVNLTQANADALFVSCSSTCTQYDWGNQNEYDNIPRSPTEWIQLSLGTTIYGVATSVELTDSDRAGLAFANGDPRSGKSVVTIATLSDGGTYNGFYGFATGQPVTNLYIGYPLRAGATMPGSQGDTFSMNDIFVAITPHEVSTPEPASFRMLGLGLSFLAIVAVIVRRRVP
jgi:PEP-CTERM motif-containing protein